MSEAAIALGRTLAGRGVGVVYGGGKVGLMGVLANAVLVARGEIIGIMPERLQSTEISHEGLTELFVVDSLHARKAMMLHLCDAFAVLPGGFGTLDECFEVLSTRQLGFHRKPLGFLNVGGYFEPLLGFLDHAVAQGFLPEAQRRTLISAGDPELLLGGLARAALEEGA